MVDIGLGFGMAPREKIEGNRRGGLEVVELWY